MSDLNKIIQKKLKGDLGTEVVKTYDLKDFENAIEASEKHSSKGRVLFKVFGDSVTKETVVI